MSATLTNPVDALAATANDHHAALHGAMRRGLAHALAAGAALNEAKARFVSSPGFGWRQWMQQRLDFDEHTARWYMRIDAFRDELPDDVLTMKGAMRFLQANGMRLRGMLSDEEIAGIYAMFDAGFGQTEIAERVGISKQGVHYHIVNREKRDESSGRRIERRPPRRRIAVDDFMIERAARWLVDRFADTGYFVRVNDQARRDALELLQLVLSPRDEDLAA